MKNILIAVLVLVAMVLAGGYIFRESIKEMMYAAATSDMYVPSDDDEFDPGIAVGSKFPAIQVGFEDGVIDSLDRFAGENGTLVIFNRSVVW